MPAVAPEKLQIALALAVALLLFAVLRQAFSNWLKQRRLMSRFSHARAGESKARELLHAQGYSILETQFSGSYTVIIDDQDLTVPLRADYLVTRAGLRYIAEVKTGTCAPHLRTPATRRQLLEYRIAFDVDGILLINAEAARIHVVQFPFPAQAQAQPFSPLGWIAIGTGIAALIYTQWW